MSAVVGEIDVLPQPPSIDIDPYAAENLINPYPYHEAMREAGPVVLLSKYNVYAVGRYDQVKTVITDHDRFTATAGIGFVDKRDPETAKFRATSPLTEEDPPLHTSTRKGVQKLLSPVVVRGWRDRFEERAEEICEEIVSRNEPVDAVKEIAERFVIDVFPESLGLDVPKEYLPQIGEMNFFSLGPPNELAKASYERVKHAIDFYDMVVKRENVKPGTFGEIIYQAEDEGIFRPGIGIGLVRTFLRGGVDTTIAGISATLYHLAKNPAQWEILRDDPSKLRMAFEEAIRLDSPSSFSYRMTTRDMNFEGYKLKGGTKVGFHTGAANRDPRVWDNPEAYDINRDIMGKHLAFGFGTHACIGQMIARLEAEVIMQALFRRIDRMEIVGETPWRVVSALRSLKALPLRFIRR